MDSLLNNTKKILTITNTDVCFQNKKIFHIENFDILFDEQIAIQAPNGSGKTCFFNSLFKKQNYFLQGQVLLGSNNHSEYQTSDLLKQGWFFVHTPPIIKNLSYLDLWWHTFNNNITEVSLRFFEHMIEKKLKPYNIKYELLLKDIGTGSTGENKLLSLIPIMFLNFDIVFLDEIETNLDSEYQNIIKNIIFKYVIQNNKAMSIISHNSEFLSSLNIKKKYSIVDKKMICL